MKITNIAVHVLKSPLDTPFAFSQGWVTERSSTLVEVTTDTGLTGWGEALAPGLEAPGIAAAVIEKALRPLIIGADPTDTEVLWHRMYTMTRDYGRKGTVVAAISAVDTALWDIAGQAAGVPVYKLLGGAFRDQVQAYATGFYRIRGQGEADRLVDEAHQHQSNGFALMKIKLGFGVRDDIDVMTKIAKAMQGKDVRLMVDSNHAYGRADAMRLGRAMNQYDLAWYEEPVVPEDVDSYVFLREHLEMPIAGGENEHTLFGFRHFLNAGAVDIAQPDVSSCGGITAARHIMTLAHANGVQTNPHVWGSAIAQAAALQVIAAIPVTHHSLFPDHPVLEYDQSDHPFRRELTAQPIQMNKNGMVAIPDKPGLGIEVNRDILARYAA